jgi:hypothetical protein
MGIYLNPGNEAFQISVSSEIYVDKSEMIAFANSRIGQEKRFLCVSRPRRFGKSMAANMLCSYYSRGCDSEALFQKLKIHKERTFSEHLNRYDVIMLNIQQFLRKAEEPEKLTECIEKKVLEEIAAAYPDYVKEGEKSLSDALASIYAKDKRENKGFLFIVDEWDCVFREFRENKTAQKNYLDFLQDLFKDRAYVRLAYMTGILPIKKYGTHSALNIFDEFSMTSPKRLAEFVGFTETEVKELCARYKMDFDEAKHWYDGYCFKKAGHIYNPKSIVDAMMEGEFQSYWTNTETYEALQYYIEMNLDGLKDDLVKMLCGDRITIDPGRFQNDMISFKDKDDIFTLLVHLGYLAYDEETEKVFLPNMEIADEFRRAVRGSAGWEILSEALIQSDALLDATLSGDEATVADAIDAVHSDETSILTYNDENSLSCVLRIAYFSARKYYTMIREMPSGKGFADIVFLPNRKAADKPALIVELKYNQSAQGAIHQILDRKYAKVLEQYTGQILLVGINYDRKTKTHECIITKHCKEKTTGE